MCGIAAYLTAGNNKNKTDQNDSNSTSNSSSSSNSNSTIDTPVFDKLLGDLVLLQNRGYDSAGISTMSTTPTMTPTSPGGSLVSSGNSHQSGRTSLANSNNSPTQSPQTSSNQLLPLTSSANYPSYFTATTNIVTSKIAGSEKVKALSLLKEFRSKHVEHETNLGIGHVRWATHGVNSSFNSHPHSDAKDRLSLVHNGIIHSYFEMKTKLLERDPDLTFKSETDSEVAAIQLGVYLDQGSTLEQAFKLLQSVMTGTWAIVAISITDPNTLFVCKNKNPLLVSIDFERLKVEVSSELTTLKNPAYALNDGTCLKISIESNKILIINCLTGLEVDSLSSFGDLEIPNSKIRKTSPHPYAHWTLSEIHEQPTTIGLALENRLDGKFEELDRISEKLKLVEHLLIFGCGSSFFSGLYATNWLRKMAVFCTVQVFDAASFTYDCLPQKVDSTRIAAIFISQSGETMDILKCLELVLKRSILTIGLINAERSTVARKVDSLIPLRVEREEAVASTKSFTAQATILLALGLWFKRLGGDTNSSILAEINSLKSFSQDVRVALKLSESCKKLASTLVHESSTSLFILGRSFSEPIALEAALKIKEISYIHAEGYLAPALKHGSYAILEPHTPCILIILNDAYKEYMISTAKELQSRHAKCICITDLTDLTSLHELKVFTTILQIPSNNHFSSLLTLIPLQLLAYELGLAKGNSIDMCRNLAKTVTVD